MFKAWTLSLFVLVSSSLAYGQSFKWDLEWYNSAAGTEKNSDSLIDPTGRRINTPQAYFETDLRLNTKYTFRGNRTNIVFRPRAVGDANQFQYSNPKEELTTETGKISLPEAYLSSEVSRRNSLAVGLQNYQWGPAELISPTNPFFHFRPDQRAYNYKENGRALLRWNFNPNSQWSLIGLYEPVNNGDSFWVYQQSFKQKAALKIEVRGRSSLNYFGVDGGLIDDSIPFVGQYANYEIFEGISLYVDGRQSQGYAYYFPFQAADTLYDLVYVRNTQDWTTLETAGIRFEGAVDLRFEYIYNGYGMTTDQLTRASMAALPQSPRGDVNLRRLQNSGRDLPGVHYAYISLRIPDVIKQNNNLSFRYLRSLQDQSATLQGSLDTAIGDAWTLFIEANVAFGTSTQELSSLQRTSGLIGLKWNL